MEGAADEQPATVGTATHYAELVRLCRDRIEVLGVSQDTMDFVCGFPRGYTGKLLVGTKNMSGHSLFTLVRALAMRLVFVHDAAELARLQRHSAWIPITNPGVLTRRRGAAWREAQREIVRRQIKP